MILLVLTSRPGIQDFHNDHLDLMMKAKGSSSNHQAWEGGYLDHIGQCALIATRFYEGLSAIAPLPFSLNSALTVLYFHDIEKIWKYSGGLPANFNKTDWYERQLPLRYDINFTEEEMNALTYVHGEGNDYCKSERTMNPLAAFCHSVDICSARIFHDLKGL